MWHNARLFLQFWVNFNSQRALLMLDSRVYLTEMMGNTLGRNIPRYMNILEQVIAVIHHFGYTLFLATEFSHEFQLH